MGITCNCENKKIRKVNENKNSNNYYKFKSEIIKRPEIGEDEFIIKINAQYYGDHSSEAQILYFVFNYPVNFISCKNGNLDSSNNTTRIKVKLIYHNNPNDQIVIDDFKVKCPYNDLEIVECSLKDNPENKNE